MQIHAERIAGVSVVSLTGNFDPRAQHEVRERVLAAVPAEASPRVLVDLEELECVDSAGLAVIVSLGRAVAERGGRLRLCAPNAGVDTFLRISRIDRAFETFPDRGSALASF